MMKDFTSGKFFGSYYDSIEELFYGVDQQIFEHKYIDNENNVERIGFLNLNSQIISAGYFYINDLSQMLDYYMDSILNRVINMGRAEDSPTIPSIVQLLMPTKKIIK